MAADFTRMNKNLSDVVSASEIASWASCPESWRLDALGAEPVNKEELERGKRFHARTAAVEVSSRRAVKTAWWTLVVAVVLLALYFAVRAGRRRANLAAANIDCLNFEASRS